MAFSAISDPSTSLFWKSASNATGLTSLAVVPNAIGDSLVFMSIIGTAATLPSISVLSGGGCPASNSGLPGAWTALTTPTTITNGAVLHKYEMWIGTVTSTGSSTLTITWASTIGTKATFLRCKQFSSGGGAGTVWAAEGVGVAKNNTASSTTVAGPTLTPGGTLRAYIAHGFVGQTGTTTGQTAGYTVLLDANNNPVLYNPNVPNSAQSPSCLQTPASTSDMFGVLFTATNPGSSRRILNINQAVNRAASY